MAEMIDEPAGIHDLRNDHLRTYCNLILDVLMSPVACLGVLARVPDVVRQLREAIFIAREARTLLGPVECLVEAL
jgi:hypothetical protein